MRRKSASERVSEREGFQRFLEVLRGFSEGFRGFSKALSECHFPLRVVGRVTPNRVAP